MNNRRNQAVDKVKKHIFERVNKHYSITKDSVWGYVNKYASYQHMRKAIKELIVEGVILEKQYTITKKEIKK